jgi:hypothetical protein
VQLQGFPESDVPRRRLGNREYEHGQFVHGSTCSQVGFFVINWKMTSRGPGLYVMIGRILTSGVSLQGPIVLTTEPDRPDATSAYLSWSGIEE